MITRWDSSKKKVIVEMAWEDARDLGYFLRDGKDPWAEELIRAAMEGAGFPS